MNPVLIETWGNQIVAVIASLITLVGVLTTLVVAIQAKRSILKQSEVLTKQMNGNHIDTMNNISDAREDTGHAG